MGQRRQVLTPGKSALHLWGAELRALRDRQGLSLVQLGERIFYDAAHLGKFERGERRPPRHIAEACDRELAGGGELVRLWTLVDAGGQPNHEARESNHEARSELDGAEPGPLLAATPDALVAFEWNHEGDGVTVPAIGPDGGSVYVTLSRRELLRILPGAAIGSAMAQMTVDTTRIGARTASMLDVHPVEHFQQLRRCLADFDNLFGAVRVLPVVLQQIRSIDKERLKRSGSDRVGLLQVQIEFADLAGWLYQDMGNYYMAQYWLDRALELGLIAHDTTTTAFILARKAQLSGDMHEPADAVEVADAAMALVEPTSRFAAIASAYGAHGHALAGDRDSFSKGYDRARDALDRAQPDDAPWGAFFDIAYIEVQCAQSFVALGDYRSAVAVFESFLTSLPSGFYRDHGVYLARAGLAHAGADDPEQAVALGLRALAVGAQMHSMRIDAVLAKLDVATARWRRLPSVADFHEELTTYHRATKADLPGAGARSFQDR